MDDNTYEELDEKDSILYINEYGDLERKESSKLEDYFPIENIRDKISGKISCHEQLMFLLDYYTGSKDESNFAYHQERPKGTSTCVCSHNPIKKRFSIVHISTGLRFIVGSQCIERWSLRIHNRMTHAKCKGCESNVANGNSKCGKAGYCSNLCQYRREGDKCTQCENTILPIVEAHFDRPQRLRETLCLTCRTGEQLMTFGRYRDTKVCKVPIYYVVYALNEGFTNEDWLSIRPYFLQSPRIRFNRDMPYTRNNGDIIEGTYSKN